MRPRRFALIVAAIALCDAPLRAHDMWIEPTTFFPVDGAIVGLRLRVGEDLLGDPLPRDPSLIDRFVVDDGAERKPVVGRDGSDPAGFVRAGSAGTLVIGYGSKPTVIEQSAAKFNQYLKEEGLEAIAAVRAERRQTDAAAREMFSRSAKSLLFAGSPRAAAGDRQLGLPLELVAERNPYTTPQEQEIPFRLLYEGTPLSGVLVVAFSRQSPADKLSARTDSAGRVRFRLRQGGMWLVKAVHMTPAPAGAAADWASHWASLTFELHGRR